MLWANFIFQLAAYWMSETQSRENISSKFNTENKSEQINLIQYK